MYFPLFVSIAFNFFAFDECLRLTEKSMLVIDVVKSYSSENTAKIVHFSCDPLESVSLLYNAANNGYFEISIGFPVDGIPFYTPHNSVFYILELSCEHSRRLLANASDAQLFSSPFTWILIEDTKLEDDYFTDLDVLIDSNVIICERSFNATYEITKVYKMKENATLVSEHCGTWSADGLILSRDFIKNSAAERSHLNGTILNTCIVITHNDSVNHLLDKREKHIDTITKVSYVFMQHMSDILNTTMNYSMEPTWGYMDNNSVWNGMIGELTSGRADVGGTPLFLTSDRVPIIDYIAMTTPTRSKFVFRQPKLSYITNVFTLPFNTTVWISSLALVVILAMGLYVVIKWEWYKKEVYDVNDDDKHLTDSELQDSVADVCFLAYGAVCQQGTDVIPFNSAGRIIIVMLYTSLMFLYTSYSANIVALLQSDSTSIQTLSDLLHSRLQVGVDDTVFNHFYFPNASEPVRRAIYLQKVVPPGQKPRYFQIDEGVRRMRDGLFAFHMETGAGYKIVVETFMEDEKCGLQEIQFLQVPDPWLAIKKNSSYKEVLKIGFRKIHESGIQNREVSLLYTKKPPCISRGSSFIGVGIVDCYPAAVVFAGGILGSLLLFFMEVVCHKLYGG